MTGTFRHMLGRAAAPLLVALLVAGVLAVQDPTPDVSDAAPILGVQGQVHYLPLDGQQLLDTLRGQQGSATNVNSPVRLITSIVSALDGNEIAIDHWEDGYDADPIVSPSATTETLNLDQGFSTVLNNLVDVANLGDITPGGSSQPYYDGGDKLVSTGAIVVTTGGWPSGAGTLHAGASVVREVADYGYEFVSPVGEGMTYPPGQTALNTLWEYTGLIIIASQDATSVTVGGSTITLDEGDSHLVDGGVVLGDTVVADKPVGVFLSTGDQGANYEGRLFDLLPTESWSDSYVTPVGGRDQGQNATRVFLFNAGGTDISVTYTQSGGGSGTITVPAGGQANRLVPNDEGMRFSSPGNPFYAIQAVTTPEAGFADSSSAHNWGFTLIPERLLTPMVVVGYGPGSDDVSAPAGIDEHDNPVWVAPQANTTIYVDVDADPTTGAGTDPNGNLYDFTCAGTALTPVLIKDTGSASCSNVTGYVRTGGGTRDMTGARIYTVDGVALAAAWGQVPSASSTGTPAIDMGTTVLPFPTIDLDKSSEILNDDGDGQAVPGDTLRYTITIRNRGISPVDDLTVNDQVPVNTTYVADSTTAGGNPMADAVTGTPFLLDEGGMVVPPVLNVGESRTVTYDLLVDDPLPLGVTEVLNEITLETDYGTYTDSNAQPVAEPGSIGDRVWDDADGDGVQDGGETGLVGVTVELVDDDGDVVGTTTTGVNGAYTFAVVYPGTYVVRVVTATLPADMAATFDLDGAATANETSVTLAADEDRTDVDFGYVPISITLAKTVYLGHNGGNSCPGTEQVTGESGDDVTYCFRVTNTGATTLVGVEVDDADLGIDETDMQVESGSLASVAPGGSVMLSYSAATIDGDLVNSADAEVYLTVGGPSATATDTAEVVELVPDISIQKTVYRGHDGGAGCPGGELETVRDGGNLTYCFEVTNTGETDLSDVAITDPDLGIAAGDIVIPLLTPGQSATRHVEVAADIDLLNTASVTGTSPAGAAVTDDDTAEIDEIHPAISLDKTVYVGHDAGVSCLGTESVTTIAGTDVTWCFRITNTGDVDLTDLSVDDLPLIADEGDMTVTSGSLASVPAGGTVDLYLEAQANGDLANTATATGEVSVGPDVSDEDTADIEVIDPSITLEKTVYAGHDSGAGCAGAELVQAEPGDDVTYCFEVTNAAGEGLLTNVGLDDADLGVDEGDLTLVSGDITPLADGASATWYLEAAVDGDLVNTATATATPAAGPDVSDSDTAEVDEVNAAIAIEKAVYGGHDDGDQCDTAADSYADENGAPVTWCFTVTNTGDADLVDVVVDDADLGIDESDLTVLSGSLATLAPGASVVLYLEGTVDGDLINLAATSATPPVGSDVTAEDIAEVDELVPGVSLEKTVYRGHDGGVSCAGVESVIGRAGDAVTWCILVTNTGDTDIDTQVTDPDIGLDEAVDLGPGNTQMLFVEGTVDGDLVNTASVTGDSPGGHPVDDDDTAEIDEVHPALTIAKTVNGGHDNGAGCDGVELLQGLPGDDVTYCFHVTNTGDTDLTDITVDDADLGVDQSDLTVLSGSLALLGSGEDAVLYLDTTLDGDLTNTATATGVAPVGPDVSDDDTAEVDEVNAAIAIEKAVYGGHDDGDQCDTAVGYHADVNGAPVTWCFTVTNTGDADLVDVVVDDADLGIDESDLTVLSGSLATLAPGASVVLYLEGTVDGDLINTASTSATPPGRRGRHRRRHR